MVIPASRLDRSPSFEQLDPTESDKKFKIYAKEKQTKQEQQNILDQPGSQIFNQKQVTLISSKYNQA